MKRQKQSEEKLYGAFISVLIVGAFIVGSWLSIYYLFITR
ncbi:cytochrome c oxidase subunit 2A [Aquisalibacillus elongatus]|uniref:Cytochrome c oxidase subunit IIa family protein n=1 Tax=Aquisalibacillus elongatus TaxID=485577 RepID=A0A3N5B6A7_9BACI|nr:cytochrome c oxidase subunit 2A [Aquisalibacillus elongatus]RPF53226.1 cytochrome c oxidase subunit IIa family protein [Aquisalibacillus elongatus]